MTKFRINAGTILDLMPLEGIIKLLGDKIRSLADDKGIPRANLYLALDKPEETFKRAINTSAKEFSPFLHIKAKKSDPTGQF